MIQRYRIRNLDCPSCGLKIENGLKNLAGVNYAVVDFANLTLHLDAEDLQRVKQELRRIDPGVEIDPLPSSSASSGTGPTNSSGTEKTFDPKQQLLILSAALILFGIHFAFENRMHQASAFFLEYGIALAAYLLAGWNVLQNAWRTLCRRNFLDENVLMVVATGGAFAVHAVSEAIAVMIFYKVGELLQKLAVTRSRRSIRALLASRPASANLETPKGLLQVPPEEVPVGGIILIKPGEKVPLDGEIVLGDSQLDTSALTGEPVPLTARAGDPVRAGEINLSGALKVRVTRPFKDSSIAKILDLVQNASARKADTEKFITRFARYYTPAVVFAAIGIAVVPPLTIPHATFQTWIYRSLVLLVISCPCALVVSIPLGYFGGIGRASHQGILIKGSNYLDALAEVKTVVFDKTGTLTRGVFEVEEVVANDGYSRDHILEIAAAAEYHSNHPIAKSILKALSQTGREVDPAALGEHTEIAGGGVKARIGNSLAVVGNDALMHRDEITHNVCVVAGTVAHVALDGNYLGYITISDRIKPEAAEAMIELRRQGVERIVMLTGDNACAAEAVAGRLHLDAFQAELLPEDKVSAFETISHGRTNSSKTAFVGDGINDAPVIARADVGIAMGGLGSDAAVETADVVLMTDSPSKIAEAIHIGKQTRRIIWQNIVMALAVKGIFVGFGALGMASMWEAVFADMGVALAAVVNSTRALRTNQPASKSADSPAPAASV
jgi:Cd2+/Zn2+-exporting ATPase